MLLSFGHGIVVVVDDGGVDDESFPAGSEVAKGLVRMKNPQSLGNNFQDEAVISVPQHFLHHYLLRELDVLALEY